jgi:hypothetical protein
MTNHDAIIVHVLALCDAPRLAPRSWTRYAAANRALALGALHSRGAAYRANSADDAGRKSGERELVALADAGLLKITRVRKFPYLKLTPKGDAYARAVAGLPGRKIGQLILGAIAAKTQREPKTLRDLWLAEIDLNRGRGWGPSAKPADRVAIADVELDALAAMANDWIVAHSTVAGHCYYALTSAGWAEADNPTPTPRFGKLPKADQKAARLYRSVQDRQLGALGSDAPERHHGIGHLPLPAGAMTMPVPQWAGPSLIASLSGATPAADVDEVDDTEADQDSPAAPAAAQQDQAE